MLHAASTLHATKAQPGEMDDRRNRIRSPTGLRNAALSDGNYDTRET